ncbi:hypothetical protein [Carboxylicivirga caseinilyticus]|uniref:hypothetical protein n=1 Tax=Carboxylicivirga caseinilyticus TaxID=3417572 RepID=UPI003D32923A|nr:hypothetical protein [Marinilabiliaceae bacterium A049]
MAKRNLNNWLLISGNGRHVGKTWLAERFIHQLSESENVVAIKIASHMHQLGPEVKWLDGGPDKWMIGEETDTKSDKDSVRMLKAGAEKVFYAQMNDDIYNLDQLNYLDKVLTGEELIICESASIGNFINPGAAFYVYDPNNIAKNCNWSFSYQALESLQSKIVNPPKKIRWEKNSWIIN